MSANKRSIKAAGAALLLFSVFLTSACSADAVIGNSAPTVSKSGTNAVTFSAAPFPSRKDSSEQEDEDWAIYVIGNNDPLPDNYRPQTKAIEGERLLDVRCADYAIQMLKDAKAQGVGLYVTSSYRSTDTQRANLQNYIKTLISKGYSQEAAAAQAQKEIALPGCSEHNAGLAMDVVSSDYWVTHSELEESFDRLPQYTWLTENAWKYGFILSYPKGKENITGFIYEPWHYRFVGLKHAERIHEIYESTGEFLTLNEYIEQYMK